MATRSLGSGVTLVGQLPAGCKYQERVKQQSQPRLEPGANDLRVWHLTTNHSRDVFAMHCGTGNKQDGALRYSLQTVNCIAVQYTYSPSCAEWYTKMQWFPSVVRFPGANLRE